MTPSMEIILALALVTLMATCAKICFRLMVETERRRSESRVDEVER